MKNKKKAWIPFLFLAPYLIIYFTFTLYPTTYSMVLSFMKYKGGKLIFNGLKNFTYLFADPVFFKAIINTFIILIIQVPIQTFLAVVIADILNKKTLKCKGIFRMIIFMPILIDTVSYSIVFRLFFNTENGMINTDPRFRWNRPRLAERRSPGKNSYYFCNDMEVDRIQYRHDSGRFTEYLK